MKKILMIHNYYQSRDPSGESISFESEVNLLRENGHEVLTYVRHNDEINEYNFSQKIGLAANTIWSRRTTHDLSEIIKKESPDIAHFQNTFPMISPSAYQVCRKAGVPVIQTLRNYRIFCAPGNLYRNNRICESCIGKAIPWPSTFFGCYRESRLQSAVIMAMQAFHKFRGTWTKDVNLFITLTEFSRSKFIAGGLPPERIVVKPNFIGMDPGIERTKDRYAVYIGRLAPEKGVLTMLEAWETLPDIPLKIIGDGPMMSKVKGMVSDPLLSHVNIYGKLTPKNTIDILKKAWCLIFPSQWYETFGRTVIEAFACGTPVIVSKIGSITALVIDGQTGLHFTCGDSYDLVKKVRKIFSSSHTQGEMGRRARAEYEVKYTAEINYEKLTNIYNKLTTPTIP